MWDRAEAALERALVDKGLEFELNPGDGAFYGPKIDLHMTDSIGRPWQLGTVQLDYYMPERFELTYTGADNAEHRPAMIHRALMGSFERFIGILIEHYAGEFPLWLAPVQAAVLPLSDRHAEYAREVQDALTAAGLRAELDDRTESIGRKIREAELRKVPYMLVVGDREAEQRAVALRRHREGDQGTLALDDAVERLAAEAAGAQPARAG
jgi:threonyl-tRNA synthetase